MADVIEQNPDEIFLVEGHTGAVGSDVMNLGLYDRRAEADEPVSGESPVDRCRPASEETGPKPRHLTRRQ